METGKELYTFRVKINNKWNNEIPDPYAKAVGINGKRAMVIDLKDTDPKNWAMDKSPAFSNGMHLQMLYYMNCISVMQALIKIRE